MKAELRTQWLAKLRSGEIPQGVGALEKDGKCCCLGVLCLVAKVPRTEHVFMFDDALGSPAYSNSTVYGRLHAEIEGHGSGCKRIGTLMHMNDNGKSFAEIADWIETHIPEEAS